MIEIEVQNETHQTQERVRFAAVPRIGEGLRLREPDGIWASYDVLDVWYQKAEYGDIWMPYLHVCMTPDESASARSDDPIFQSATTPSDGLTDHGQEHDDGLQYEGAFASLAGESEPFKI